MTVATAMTLCCGSLYTVSADDLGVVTHTVTFLNFDGDSDNPLAVFTLEDGQKIDYSLVDTSSLNGQINEYTQIRFHAWDIMPETADNDYTIQALSEIGTIESVSLPSKTDYYSDKGVIDLSGLNITITLITQTSELDDDGNRLTTKTSMNIANSCYTIPGTLDEAFADGDTAEISIFPIASDVAIDKYIINCYKNIGDIDLNGIVDAVDSSYILSAYARQSTGGSLNLTDEQIVNADIDRNNIIDAVDASYALKYYALKAVGKNPSWDDIIN